MNEKNPHQLAEEIVNLADECGRLAERYDELNRLYAEWWKTFRADFKSDKAAEKEWDLTLDGQEMQTIKTKIKTKDRKISAYKMFIRVLTEEAHNQF